MCKWCHEIGNGDKLVHNEINIWTLLTQLLMHTGRNVVVHSCKRFLVRPLAAAWCSDEFESAIFQKFLEHTTAFLQHRVVVQARSPSFGGQIGTNNFLPVFALRSWPCIWFLVEKLIRLSMNNLTE